MFVLLFYFICNADELSYKITFYRIVSVHILMNNTTHCILSSPAVPIVPTHLSLPSHLDFYYLLLLLFPHIIGQYVP